MFDFKDLQRKWRVNTMSMVYSQVDLSQGEVQEVGKYIEFLILTLKNNKKRISLNLRPANNTRNDFSKQDNYFQKDDQ